MSWLVVRTCLLGDTARPHASSRMMYVRLGRAGCRRHCNIEMMFARCLRSPAREIHGPTWARSFDNGLWFPCWMSVLRPGARDRDGGREQRKASSNFHLLKTWNCDTIILFT